MSELVARPVIVITGAAGDIGSGLGAAFDAEYAVVGLDRPGKEASVPLIPIDLTDDQSVDDAFTQLRERHGTRIASVIHLAAYFDFSGDNHPLYESVNVEGTRRLLRALQSFDVEQFVYSGTMLVHEPCAPGERIDENRPIAPRWAYPRSKARAEDVIRQEHGRMPFVLLHLAGVYDERTAVPTLSQQIARIYERDFKSHVYAGEPRAGQSLLHRDDMIDAFRRVVARRRELPRDAVILIGEPDAAGYGELQERIGCLVHGEAEWRTLRIPKPAARAGAWLEEKLELVVPDALDQGDKPFIRPFMVSLADDHYALDISRASALLGWQPRHRIETTLPRLVQALKDDPPGWYEANGITPPEWIADAREAGRKVEALRTQHEAAHRESHRRTLWAHFANIALGTWLVTSPAIVDVDPAPLAWSDVVSGLLLIGFAASSLSWRVTWPRWACAAIGFWVMSAPILMWTPDAAAYVNDTLVGALVIAFAVALPPEPGVSRVASVTGPDTPPGWSYNPSTWTQRLPIIALAFIGLYVSRYLAAYQLGHIDGVWEPFFEGGPDPKNGTEEIITSSVSKAWPVSDAAVGALTYLLEILTGAIGSRRRWRTMPWLVMLFGLMIVPLGIVSIFFIIIQPIWIGTWCTLCLIGAAAMIIQIPYSLDELLASGQFLRRRRRAGQRVLRVFLFGDTEDGPPDKPEDEFARSPGALLREMVAGGVSLPWSLALCIAIGIWLMLTRLTLDAAGPMASADHLIGALLITVSAIACAEVARGMRWLNVPLGAALLITPFVFEASPLQTAAALVCGVAVVLLSIPKGRISESYSA